MGGCSIVAPLWRSFAYTLGLQFGVAVPVTIVAGVISFSLRQHGLQPLLLIVAAGLLAAPFGLVPAVGMAALDDPAVAIARFVFGSLFFVSAFRMVELLCGETPRHAIASQSNWIAYLTTTDLERDEGAPSLRARLHEKRTIGTPAIAMSNASHPDAKFRIEVFPD